jgi:hypothetical protein
VTEDSTSHVPDVNASGTTAVGDVEALRPPGRVGLLTDKLLTAVGERDAHRLLNAVDSTWGGMWIGGDTSSAKIATCRDAGYEDVLLVGDQESYCKHTATPERPFDIPEVLGDPLSAVLDDQLARGADVATTPSLYVLAGDAPSLKAMVQQAGSLQRDDTILVIPVAVAWANNTFIDQFIAILRLTDMPIALRLASQYDPLAQFKAAPANLRRIEAEVPHLMRLCTDLSAIDGLCHKAFAGAIGLTSSRRHLVPPGEKPDTAPNGGQWPPSVLVRELLSYVRTTTLAKKFANTPAPSCSCAICQGQRLTRLLDPVEDKIEAYAHNIAVWSDVMTSLLRDWPQRVDRAVWWKKRCKVAVDQHALFNTQLGNPKAFVPSDVLTRWADLP